MKDVSDLTYKDVNISNEEKTVTDMNSSVQHESLKKEIETEIKINENTPDEKYSKVKELNEQLTQNNAQSQEDKAEINLFLFNDASNNRTDKEILVDGTENIISNEGNNLTVLPQEVNGTNLSQSIPVEETKTPEIRPEEEKNHEDELCNLTSVIEISEDGTWDTAELPSDNIKQIKNQNIQNNENQNISQDFLTSNFTGSNLSKQSDIHSAQYYINSQIESDNLKKHEKDEASNKCINEKARNIGAQIMEKYDEERQKIKDSKNLPDVSLLDVEESLEDIQKERRKIIESQAVRAKRIDSWIKGGSVGSSMEFEKMDSMDGQKSGDEQPINAQAIDYSWAQNPLLTQLIMDYTADGEVVYDSILENKQKTKVFWEQLMLAANLGTDPPSLTKTVHHVHSNIIEEKIEGDSSEPEFYDAQAHNISDTSPEITEGVDSPKIIEVSKKIISNMDDKTIQSSTEATETKIAASSEKDFRSIEDREQSLQQKLKKQAESKIVLEMREMREREEEWRRNQMAYQISLSSVGATSSFKEEEAFISIPTTDEGNYSEYGSEEKEEPSLNGINRMMSPDVSANQNSIGFQHQRTQSLDSMSSGHSSGSGSVTQLEQVPTINRSGRRGITVKPLDEPEDDSSVFIWREKETPIEREIRIAYEREEELRREKSLPFKDSPSSTLKKGSTIQEDEKIAAETPKRLATKRIENEIEQARKREKELKQYHKEDVDTNETQLPSQIPHSVSNIATSNIINLSSKTETSTLKQNITIVSNSKPTKNINISAPPSIEPKETTNNIQNRGYTSNNNVETLPKRFQPNLHQKGLMKRFLASRGKISSGFTFSTNHVEPSRSPVTPTTLPVATDMFFSSKSPRESYYDKTENSTLGSRPGYTSAEDKIQFELMEMRKREEELRRERARSLARSQPDLLSLVNDEEEREKAAEEEDHQETENLNKLPPMAKLRSALSNPSLLDIDIKQTPVQRKQKRKSALIEEWEYRIQQSHNNE